MNPRWHQARTLFMSLSCIGRDKQCRHASTTLCQPWLERGNWIIMGSRGEGILFVL